MEVRAKYRARQEGVNVYELVVELVALDIERADRQEGPSQISRNIGEDTRGADTLRKESIDAWKCMGWRHGICLFVILSLLTNCNFLILHFVELEVLIVWDSLWCWSCVASWV